MTDLAATERANLSELLDQVGPDAPTLCEGWHTRDLTAHLVLRERRPDAIAGIVIPPLSGWTARVQRKLARGSFTQLVNEFRGGPPIWSLFRPRAVGELLSGLEFFVHHEDVRRALRGWEPRSLDGATNALLWRRSTRMAKHALRSHRGGLELIRVDTGQHHTARPAAPGQSVLRVTGAPQELLLYMFGRRDHALVELEGDVEGFPVLEKA